MDFYSVLHAVIDAMELGRREKTLTTIGKEHKTKLWLQIKYLGLVKHLPLVQKRSTNALLHRINNQTNFNSSKQNKKGLEHKKTGKFQDKLKNSGLVPEVGQISNFLKDDIKLILELEKRDIKLT